MAKRILVVDDDADLVEATKVALELAGFEVLTAGSGAEGVAKAQSEKPDLTVLDVTMETAGAGFRAARALRADADLREMPLIMLTAINRADGGLRYGADDDWNPVDVFLDKPVPPDKLIAEIRKILG